MKNLFRSQSENKNPDDDRDYLLRSANRKIRRARNYLLFIGIFLIALPAFIWYESDKQLSATLELDGIIGLMYIMLAILTKRNPHFAIWGGLILYILIIIASAIQDPRNLYEAMYVKVFVIIALVSGIRAVKKAEILQQESARLRMDESEFPIDMID